MRVTGHVTDGDTCRVHGVVPRQGGPAEAWPRCSWAHEKRQETTGEQGQLMQNR